MSDCPQCGRHNPGGGRFCAACGAALGSGADAGTASGADSAGGGGPLDATVAVGHPPRSERRASRAARISRPDSRRPSSSSRFEETGYPPGTLIDERYRIVGLLGKGGMGEVYRADDLVLGQSVALKFLPDALARDPEWKERFLNEVRVARQVAHPNVCRVYDVGETGGRLYISMEYIDGEDLASLLRRIGRLPQEKGVEIARQLCAGLDGLHDRGVLHRDLKPANVMLDGRGRVRITDFGLAGLAEQIRGSEVRAGTPAYMAPEQITGARVSTRSDIYALGLVLYEMFTGRQAFSADSLAEFSRLHQESTPVSPSTILTDIDPAVERVIGRCLEKDPEARPPSAISVAAALPGADPLAAALAAGEIPSLEMVAAAGAKGRTRPLVAVLYALAVVVAVAVQILVNVNARLYHYDPLAKPTVVLEDRAREIAGVLGYTEPPADMANGYATQRRVLRYMGRVDQSPGRWQTLEDARPPGLLYWYRQSPEDLVPLNRGRRVSLEDPPLAVSGMLTLWLDTMGRLVRLRAVPAPHDTLAAIAAAATAAGAAAASPAEPDWLPLFQAAGLDPQAFTPATPEWLPVAYADRRAAWTGHYPDDPSLPIRLEAAAYRSRPVYFETVGPWTESVHGDNQEPAAPARAVLLVIILLVVFVLGGGIFMALRNVRLGRGDLAGARRLSIFVFLLAMGFWFLVFNHSADPGDEINSFFGAAGEALVAAALFWSFYLALEPYVRKHWPGQIVTWSRLLMGHFRDPLVGRDILVGGVYFLSLVLLEALIMAAREVGGIPLPVPSASDWGTLLGPTHVVVVMLANLIGAVFNPMFFMLSLLILRVICRSQRGAIAAFALLVTTFVALTADQDPVLAAAGGLLVALIYSVVLFRFGLLPFMVGFYFHNLIEAFPIVLGGGAWYASAGYAALAAIVGITGFGLYQALAGRSQFAGEPWVPEGR